MSNRWHAGRKNRSVGDVELLIVESDPDDASLLASALAEAECDPGVSVAHDGDDALEFLRGAHARTPRPNLILLATLPEPDTADVLAVLAADPVLSEIPVVVLLDETAPAALRQSYDRDANACLRKPREPAAIWAVGRSIAQFWLETARLPPLRAD